MGICAVAPALAVIVAVRFAKLKVPDLKVKVADPSDPVVTIGALTIPVSVDKLTAIPDKAAFEPSSAVTVIVVEPELSEGTEGSVAESCNVAAVVTTPPDDGAEPPSPQPVNNKNKEANKNKILFL